MHALIVTNMYPSAERPALGSFVRDQVEALRRLDGLTLELFAFSPGGAGSYRRAASELRRRYRSTRFDVVHAHFGLSIWPSLAVPTQLRAATLHGTDLSHPRSRPVSLAALRFIGLPAVVSAPLAADVPGWAVRRPPAVLPCGVDVERFRPIDKADARRQLGLDPDRRLLLFPADPSRPEKRYDRARAVAGETELLTLGAVDPALVPLWVNAADAVLVTSERESFGLAVLEALACEVPVLATREGIAPEALAQVPGTLCAGFDAAVWRNWLDQLLSGPQPRSDGRARAARWSAARCAEQVLAAWTQATGR